MSRRWPGLGRRWPGLAARRRGQQAAEEQDAGPYLDEALLRQINRLGLTSRGVLTELLAGEHVGLRKTQAIEFADYRGYVPGDDFRAIDWNAYARLGELFVKTSLASESLDLSLLLDCSRSMAWGKPNKLGYAKRLAAALGAVALLHSDSVRLYALGDGRALAGPFLNGPSALQGLDVELGRMAVAQGTDLPSSIAQFRELADARGIMVLISDLLVPMAGIEALGGLATDTSLAAVLHIVDPREAVPAAMGSVELRDIESGEQLTLTVTSALRDRYARQFEARARDLEAACAAEDVRYVRISTSVPPHEVVAGAMRREDLVQA